MGDAGLGGVTGEGETTLTGEIGEIGLTIEFGSGVMMLSLVTEKLK